MSSHCRPTLICQASWSPSPWSHGRRSLPSSSWPLVYLQPSLLTHGRKQLDDVMRCKYQHSTSAKPGESEHFETWEELVLCSTPFKCTTQTVKAVTWPQVGWAGGLHPEQTHLREKPERQQGGFTTKTAFYNLFIAFFQNSKSPIRVF